MMNGRTNSNNTGVNDLQVPLDSVTNFTVVPDNGFVSISWTDPDDKYATPEGQIAQDPQQLVSEFDYTIVVRKEGVQPINFKDGDAVVLSATRNQYQNTPYIDSGVEYETTYYYAAWTFNKDGVPSDGVFAEPVIPKYYDPVLKNNSWERINEACENKISESLWEIGDEKVFSALNRSFTAVILDFNHDNLADRSGTASISFGAKELVGKLTYSGYRYSTSSARTYLLNTISPSMDPELSAFIKPVIKLNGYTTYNHPNTYYHDDTSTSDALFLFGSVEAGYTRWESDRPAFDGTLYPYFSTQSNRAKGDNWWTRCGYNGPSTQWNWVIMPDGRTNNYINADGSNASICFGFCM